MQDAMSRNLTIAQLWRKILPSFQPKLPAGQPEMGLFAQSGNTDEILFVIDLDTL
jgi:hypothetical protein